MLRLRAKHGIIKPREHDQTDIGMVSRLMTASCSPLKAPQPHIRDEGIELGGLQGAARFLEAVDRDDILAGVNEVWCAARWLL